MLNTITIMTKGVEIFQTKDFFPDLQMKHLDSNHVINVWSDHVVPWDSPANTKEEIKRDLERDSFMSLYSNFWINVIAFLTRSN